MNLLLLLACHVGEPATDQGSGDAGDDSDVVTCDPFVDEPVDKDPGTGDRPARLLAGTVVTTLDFDADAEATGLHDCTYTRSYAALPEITDQGWLCPDCDWATKGDATIIDGYDDCYVQISDSDATRVEHLGFLTDAAGTHLYRSSLENLPLTDTGALVDPAALATGTPFDIAYADDGTVDAGGTLHLSAAGTFTATVSDSLVVADPAGARTEPYACGWPLQSPGGPVLSWDAVAGETFPNVRLRDQCGEDVDLWDFRGRYVVLDSASPDCGPCNAMADTAEAFKAAMAAECIEVETITLLNLSLRAVNKPADDALLDDWVSYHHLASPVLADEGFGYDVLGPFVQTVTGADGMALPSAVLLAPDGRLVTGDSGYSDDSGGWDKWAELIRADVAAHPS